MKRKNIVPVLLLLLIFWFTRLENSAVLATQADEGVHITVAELVSSRNLKIYSDLFENRTPGVEWLLAAWFQLAGASVFAARVLTIAVTLLGGAILYALAKHTSGGAGASLRTSAVAASGAVSLYMLDPLALFWSRFAMLEHYSTTAAAASILAASIAIQKRSATGWFLSGLLAGLAIIFKQTEAVVLAAFLTFFGLQAIRSGKGDLLRAALSWASGLVLVAALLLTVLALQASLQPFVRFVTHAGEAGPLLNLSGKVAEMASWWLRTPALWFSLPALLFVSRRGNEPQQLVLLWFGAELAFLFLPPDLDLSPGGFSHYVLPVVAAASVLASSGTVGLWRALHGRRRLLLGGGVTALIMTTLLLPTWYEAYTAALTGTGYPQATVEQETDIGRAAALLTASDRPILVVGNAIFYSYAQRVPASRYFHWPAYLAQSELAGPAIKSVASALDDARTGAVVMSRLHLEERLPQELQSSLWRTWAPAALFPYAYQRDVLLFVPRSTPPGASAVVARYGDQFTLLALDTEWLDEQNLLVRLWWRAERAPQESHTVFVHLLGDQGTLVAQDDAVPAVGFRPTATWQEGEAVLDYHWIKIPDEIDLNNMQLSVGLYESSSGERLRLDDDDGAPDSYRRPLQLVP